MQYFITAIGTDSGKTLVSAVLTEALHADYWKPVQAGFPTDSNQVAQLVSNSDTTIHPEQFVLKTPASPHMAASIDGVEIQPENFTLPKYPRDLVVEGAGGCLVPLNDHGFMVVDLAEQFNLEVILVANLYLGSINHTLLTVNLLQSKNVKVKGIIFNGEANPHSEGIILKISGYKKLMHIPKLEKIDKSVVAQLAIELKKALS